jgi:hypothetical protein
MQKGTPFLGEQEAKQFFEFIVIADCRDTQELIQIDGVTDGTRSRVQARSLTSNFLDAPKE